MPQMPVIDQNCYQEPKKENKISPSVVDMAIQQEEKKQQELPKGYELINQSQAVGYEKDIQKDMDEFHDMGTESVYPLMTSDKTLQKEFIIKTNINNEKLDKVFDPQNHGKFNLNSVYIMDDYIQCA